MMSCCGEMIAVCRGGHRPPLHLATGNTERHGKRKRVMPFPCISVFSVAKIISSIAELSHIGYNGFR